MITAIGGTQRECVLLDGSQVQQNEVGAQKPYQTTNVLRPDAEPRRSMSVPRRQTARSDMGP